MKPQWLNRSLIVGPYLTLCTLQPSSEFKAYSIQCIAQELMAEFARQTIR